MPLYAGVRVAAEGRGWCGWGSRQWWRATPVGLPHCEIRNDSVLRGDMGGLRQKEQASSIRGTL